MSWLRTVHAHQHHFGWDNSLPRSCASRRVKRLLLRFWTPQAGSWARIQALRLWRAWTSRGSTPSLGPCM